MGLKPRQYSAHNHKPIVYLSNQRREPVKC